MYRWKNVIYSTKYSFERDYLTMGDLDFESYTYKTMYFILYIQDYQDYINIYTACFMMTSWHENTFRVTDTLCGQYTSHEWFPSERASTSGLDASLKFA